MLGDLATARRHVGSARKRGEVGNLPTEGSEARRRAGADPGGWAQATRLLGDLQRGRRRVAAPGELQAARLLGDLATPPGERGI